MTCTMQKLIAILHQDGYEGATSASTPYSLGMDSLGAADFIVSVEDEFKVDLDGIGFGNTLDEIAKAVEVAVAAK